MVGSEDIHGRQRRWRWFGLCFERFLLGLLLQRFLTPVFPSVLLERNFLCAKRHRGNEQEQHRSDAFLSHFLLWILVTVREAVEQYFAEKQQIIFGHSDTAGELLHLRINNWIKILTTL